MTSQIEGINSSVSNQVRGNEHIGAAAKSKLLRQIGEQKQAVAGEGVLAAIDDCQLRFRKGAGEVDGPLCDFIEVGQSPSATQ